VPVGKCDCGCVPNILGLFEMAELRKQLRADKEEAARGRGAGGEEEEEEEEEDE
jgi:hypothetical protein